MGSEVDQTVRADGCGGQPQHCRWGVGAGGVDQPRTGAGIAARTCDYLAARGFAGAQIGDAKTPQAQSLIKYPATARARAVRIAAQFAVTPKLEASEGPLTLIIGRDARRAGRTG